MKLRLAGLVALLAIGQPLGGTANIVSGWDYVNGRPVKLRAASDGTLATSGAGGGGGGSSFSNDGSTAQLARVIDADTGAGSHYTAEAILMTPGSGGPTQTGTAANPLRIDWTGMSVGVSSLPGSPAQEHTTAASPNACRLSDGAAFYDGVKTGQLPAALDGSGFLKVHEQGTASCSVTNASLAVTGTFWQATQAVSNAASDPAYIAPGSTSAPTKAEVTMGKTSDATPQYQPIPLWPAGAAVRVGPRQVSTYSAVFRLAARPYPLSNVFAAAGRKQFATIYHTNTATKTIKIREVLVMVRTISAAAIVSAEFVRLTSATTPATGNPAVTPQFHDVSATLEATCLALPTTAGTENVNSIINMWQFETAAVTPAVGSTEPPVDLPWKTLYSGDGAADEQLPIMAASAAGGFAVVIDANAAVTVTALVKIRFTEE